MRTLCEAGVPVQAADDPLLFGSRLAAQFVIARDAHGFTNTELATRPSVAARLVSAWAGAGHDAGQRQRLARHTLTAHPA